MGNFKSFSKSFLYIFALLTVGLLYQNCEDSPTAPSNAAVIEGKAVQSETGRGVPDVLVSIFGYPEQATTDSSGFFSFEVSIGDSSQRTVSVRFTKDGYRDTFVSLTIRNGAITAIPSAEMIQDDEVTTESDSAAAVILESIQFNKIYVKGTGATESSILTFEVRDAKGVPVDFNNKVRVEFRIANNGLNGGEFLYPNAGETDNNGRVSTAINSGTIAGAIQIIAQIRGANNNIIISSSPIPITISGGLPDQAHFSIASEKLNFPGYNKLNERNLITVLVGDKYSNPVPEGTSVHFQTNGGVIQSPASTNDDGLGTVELISGGPRPQGVPFGSLRILNAASLPSYFNQPGYGLVTAQTVNENGTQIFAEHVVLFSGVTQISNVSPTSFTLNPNTSQDFTFSVSDQNLNPLSEGTEITVTTNNGSVAGDISIRLGDTQSRGATSFSFKLTNSKPDEIEGEDTTVTISVESPNGRASFNISGIMYVTAP